MNTRGKRPLGTAILTAMLLLLAPAASLQAAAPTVCLGASATNVKAGDTVSVDVQIYDVANLNGAVVELHFDATRLEVVEVATGPLFGSEALAVGTHDNGAGKIERAVFAARLSGVQQADSPVYTVRFRVKSGAANGNAVVNIAPVTSQTQFGNGVDLYDTTGKKTGIVPAWAPLTLKVAATVGDPKPLVCAAPVVTPPPPPPVQGGGSSGSTGGGGETPVVVVPIVVTTPTQTLPASSSGTLPASQTGTLPASSTQTLPATSTGTVTETPPVPAVPPNQRRVEVGSDRPGAAPLAVTITASRAGAVPPRAEPLAAILASQVTQAVSAQVESRAPGAQTRLLVSPVLVTDLPDAPVTTEVQLPPEAEEPELAVAVRLLPDGSVQPVRTRFDPETRTLRFPVAAAGTYTVIQVRRNFGDTEVHWANQEIRVMASRFVAGGYPDGSFQPDRTVNRAEFVAFLVRALAPEPDSPTPSGSAFADVPADAWYAQEVGTAVAMGLVSGVGEGQFGAGNEITREQVAVLLARALRAAGKPLPTPSSATLARFSDQDQVAPWARSDVAALVELGLMRGVGESDLAPKGVATRAQAMALLNRLLNQLD